MDLKILEESNRWYKVEVIGTGEIKTLYKIDLESLKESHYKRVRQVAEKIDKNEIDFLITHVNTLIKRKIDINEYEGIASALSKRLEKIYIQIGEPNLFHHSIKNINPCIYGKAQTFYRELESLNELLKEVKKEMEEIYNGF